MEWRQFLVSRHVIKRTVFCSILEKQERQLSTDEWILVQEIGYNSVDKKRIFVSLLGIIGGSLRHLFDTHFTVLRQF